MTTKIVRATWIGIAVLMLLTTLFAFDGKPNSDAEVVLAWSMLLLSFPSGLLVPLCHVFLNDYLSVTVHVSYLSIAIDWLGLAGLGYVQWFVLVPWIWRKWRARGTVGVL